MGKYFKLNTIVSVIDRVLSWLSKEVSNNSLTPEFSYYNKNTRTT